MEKSAKVKNVQFTYLGQHDSQYQICYPNEIYISVSTDVLFPPNSDNFNNQIC